VSHGIDHNIVSKLINPMPSYTTHVGRLWTSCGGLSCGTAYLISVSPICLSCERRTSFSRSDRARSASRRHQLRHRHHRRRLRRRRLIVRCRIEPFPPTRRSILMRDCVPATQFTSGFDCLMLVRSTEASRRSTLDRFFSNGLSKQRCL